MSDGVPPTGQPDHAIFGVVSESGPFKGYIIYPRWVREFIRRGVPSRFRGSAALLYLEVAQTIYADAKKLDYDVPPRHAGAGLWLLPPRRQAGCLARLGGRQTIGAARHPRSEADGSQGLLPLSAAGATWRCPYSCRSQSRRSNYA